MTTQSTDEGALDAPKKAAPGLRGDSLGDPWNSIELGAFALCALGVLFFLFYRFGDVPSGMYHDQVAMAYDGRALDRTLADKNGTFLPLFFFTFMDWLSPIPIYSMALSEAVFGATPFAAALPSAIFAIGMAVGLFYLLRELTGRARLARWMALLSLLVPSIFLYARYGFEASFLPCLLVLALITFLRFEREPSRRNALWAGVAIGVCTYTYPTGRMLAPLIVAAAAVSFYLYLPTRRQLWAFLASAAALGAPMGIYMLRYPERLLTRLNLAPAWEGHPGFWVVVQRIAHTYFWHFSSVDFLFRTGQKVIWHNAGEGLLPVWIAAPMILGVGSLWLRRKTPFARTLAATLLLSPIPVCLTLQSDFPHTSRSLQFVPLVMILAGLALADFVFHDGVPRWLPALLVAGALIEGAQDLSIYFNDWGPAQQRSMDNDVGAALRILFSNRQGEEPMYLPAEFFEPLGSGTRLDFWGDLDPVRLRAVGLDGLGFHRWDGNTTTPGLLATSGRQNPPPNAIPIGATPMDAPGPPAWRLYRIPASP